MENIFIRFSKKCEAENIAKLSGQFALENSCNGIVADTPEYFKNKNVIVAVLNNKIIGYCYGEIEIEEKNRSFAVKGDKYFDLEEVYVLPEYRKLGIGQKLFNYAENYATENNCKTVQLNAVSKDYKKLLSFYIDKLNMQFWSAYLIKKI